MKDVEFKATGFEVPERIVTNDDLTKLMATSDEWISKRTGIKQRHISTKENTSDLALKVGQKILAQAKIKAEDLDLIVVATMSPDNMTPSTAAIVQGKLGATNAIAFDLSAACSGFSYAISVARAFLLANQKKRALVIGAEVLSKLLDWRDRTTAVLFGDGAGGVLLETSTEKHLLSQDLATYGDLGNKLIAGHLSVESDFLTNQRQLSAFAMDGREVYRFATHKVPVSLERAADKAHLALDKIDYFLLHQANRRIIEQVAKRLKQPMSKFPLNINEYGNTAAASEAILLAECVAKKIIKKGNIVALSGFGGGLTVGTIIFKF